MSTFKRKEKIVWAKKAQIMELADELLDLWEDSKLPVETVIEKAQLVLEDAASGELKLDGKNIYVVELRKQFENAGLEIPKNDEQKTSSTSLSKYA